MTSSRPLLSLCVLLLAGAVAGCDTETPDEPLDAREAQEAPGAADALEAPDTVPADAHVVGHVDLDALTSAPWIAGALEHGKLAMDAKLGACADVLRQADSVTFGGKQGAFEAYVEGSFDAAAANACTDHIDAEIASHAERLDGRPKPEAVLLADGVLVVFAGDLTPSRERLEGLLAADPGPSEPLWIAASTRGEGHPVERMRAWANPAEGLRVHAEVVFVDEQKAAEIYGKANLGLAAMSMSDELGELASAVSLGSSGAAITADVALTDEQMKTVAAKAEAHHRARAQHHGWSHHEGDAGARVEIEVE